MNVRRLAIAVLLLSLLPLAACGNKGDLVRPPPEDAGTEAVPADGVEDEDSGDSDAPLPADDAGDGTAPSVDMLPPPDIDDIEEDNSGNDDTNGGGG
ncbi:LPS translocon maturation chaperone LptM [Luteimonas sp. R10]|uniref:LPS translocon maturation chaperone LptM n=1 Tax=Luteimonas sp. R10 TaxID=3108176 RepID=UPI00308B90ED|nr:lipoprotein [Luteimonas sp. R10]